MLTEATQLLEANEKVRALTLRRRVQLIKQLRADGNAELVVGPDDGTLNEFIRSMLEDIDAASAATSATPFAAIGPANN